MPQAIPAAAAAVASAFATAGTIAYATIYAATYTLLTVGVTVGLNSLARAQVPEPEAQKVTRKQPRPIRVIAVGGPSRMSGAYMLRESTGNKLGVVIAICEGRLASIDRVYLNDDRVTLSGGFVQGMANEKYGTGDLIQLETRLGEPTETHYSFLTADFGSRWPTTARGDGIASLGYLAQHRSQESFRRHFPHGEPIPSVVGPPVCFDWRDPAQDRDDESTWQACDNPVVWLVHLEWYRFGRSWARCIEPALDALTEEADYCDTLVSLKAGGTEKRYRLAGNYPVNTEPAAVREAILSSMDGWLSTNGKGHLVLKAGRYIEPTFTITGEHIEGYSWKAFQADEESVNELAVSYVSPDQDYTEIEAGVWRDESDITERGLVRTENLALTWVFSRSQAMRLAKRKMTRVNAPRRGQIRTGIYGLNGLGERYIRIKNPDLASMADVVCEVMNVEVDFANSQVVFDVILADENIDAWDPEEEEGEQPDPVTRPPGDPAETEPARTLTGRTVAYPTSATHDTITVVTFDGILPDGTNVTIPAGSITGLDELTNYGVFWKDGTGFEAEEYPASGHMATGSWIFIGWQATADAATGTEYPTNPTPPGGWGGGGGGSSEVSAQALATGVAKFSAVNVGGIDVKPFLDKTDGTKLTEAAALDNGVVVTQALATTAIRPGAPVTNATAVSITGLNAVGGDLDAAGATEVVSATFNVPEDGDVIIKLTAAFEATNAETCEMALFIDDAGSKSMNQIRAMQTTDANRFRLLEVNDPGGDASSAVLIVSTMNMTAGSHTARLVAMARLDPSEFTVPGGSAALEVFVR